MANIMRIGSYYIPPPTWVTPSGSLGTDYTMRNSSFVVAATTDFGSISYSVTSGSLPSGHTLNTSTGQISGTATGVSDYSSATYDFVIKAINLEGKSTDRSFSITIKSRYVGYSCSTASEGGSCNGTAPSGYVFNRKDFSAYGTPNGSCGAFTYGSCNSAASNSWNPGICASYSFPATNAAWGDPCSGVAKRGYVQMSYGPF